MFARSKFNTKEYELVEGNTPPDDVPSGVRTINKKEFLKFKN